MIRIILVDDEPLARNLLKEYLLAFPQFQVIGECGDGFEAVKTIQQLNPDLIFLDIQMPKINGFETLELLEKKPAVIFTTAFDEYALKAFELNAIDYLLKPFSPDRFAKAVQKFAEGIKEKTDPDQVDALESIPQKHQDEASRIVVKNGSNILILPTDQVTYIEAFDDYVKIFNSETFYLKKKTMTYYEQVLHPEKFVRIHRSFILNIDHLTRIEPVDKNNSLALLKNGVKIPISRSGYMKLREILNL
jgi:two-component system, LytTR family, response regulator